MRTDVPCNGCRTCCTGGVVLIHDHEDPVGYLSHLIPHPATGEAVAALDRKANGECVYLDQKGCTIWERAPKQCREFDCRVLYRLWSQYGGGGKYVSPDVFDATLKAGKIRLDRWS